MSKKNSSKDKKLKNLIQGFEESLKNNLGTFFPEDELEQIIEYYQSNSQIDKAFIVIDQAKELFPFSGCFLFKEAQLYFENKEYELAWEALHKASLFESKSSEILLLEADLFSAQGMYNEAIDKLQELYYEVPKRDRSDVLMEIADVYELAGQKEKYFKIITKTLKQFPQNEEALHRFWNYILDHEEFEASIEVLQYIIDRGPYNFLAWYYLSKVYEELELFEKAVECYQYSIAINDYYFAYWDYAFCLQSMNAWNKALDVYEEMIEQFEADPDIYNEMGYCNKKLKNYNQSIQYFIKAKEITNDKDKKAQFEYQIGKVYELRFELPNALYHYNQATDLQASKPKFWNATGKLYQSTELYQEAIECYSRSLAINDLQDKIWLRLANCYYQLDLGDLVIDTFFKATSLLPGNAEIHYYYASYLIHFGHTQSGLAIFEHALNLDSSKKNTIFALFPELINNTEVVYLLEQF